MTALEKKLRSSLKRLGIAVGSPVVVAVSGGADSIALLDALFRLGLENILTAHLNHRLRGEESDLDEEFVIEASARLNLRCIAERIDVDAEARAVKGNLEAVARRLRYSFLQRIAKQNRAEFVMTAHTMDDQAETILMRLMRGSGAEGLRGIEQARALDGEVKLVRPMLEATRAEVLDHCARRAIDYRTDSSNLEIDFTRNRVRLELLPLLRTFNPRIEAALVRAAQLISDDEEALDRIARDLLAETGDRESLRLEKLKTSQIAVRRRVIRLWLRRERGDLRRIDAAHINAIDRLITRGQSGRSIELPGGLSALREFDRLVLKSSNKAAPKKSDAVRLEPGKPRLFGGFRVILSRDVSRESIKVTHQAESGIYFALLRESDAIDDLYLRPRRPGDAYRPAGSRYTIKLKTLMIRHKLPRSERDTYPVIATADDRIVWTPGLPVADEFAIESDERGSLIIATREPDALVN